MGSFPSEICTALIALFFPPSSTNGRFNSTALGCHIWFSSVSFLLKLQVPNLPFCSLLEVGYCFGLNSHCYFFSETYVCRKIIILRRNYMCCIVVLFHI
ncbi:hypothetical protein ACJIZ3_017770 [Penstemon smallii]|uniref:Secreted protein n=1 Tax=Penstemon smallii TaxID=265156 RepID=A0ABD3SWX9_9LAMI